MITLNNLMSTSARDNIPNLFGYLGRTNKINLKVNELIGHWPRIRMTMFIEGEFALNRHPTFHYIIDDNIVAQFIKLYDYSD